MCKKYASKYTDKLVTGPQKIAEIMVERKHKDLKLPQQFWNDDRFKRDFLLQLRFANSLIKLYSVEAIINALKTPAGSKIYSLTARWLDGIIVQEQHKLEQRAIVTEITQPKENPLKKESVVGEIPTSEAAKPVKPKQTLFNKLDTI